MLLITTKILGESDKNSESAAIQAFLSHCDTQKLDKTGSKVWFLKLKGLFIIVIRIINNCLKTVIKQ